MLSGIDSAAVDRERGDADNSAIEKRQTRMKQTRLTVDNSRVDRGRRLVRSCEPHYRLRARAPCQ